MMQALRPYGPRMINMVTVGELYTPLAGTGQNTMRRLSQEYSELVPGDLVNMTWTPELDENGEPRGVIALERLCVTSFVILPYAAMLRSVHLVRNHGRFGGPETAHDFFRLVYDPTPENETEFMAIYFQ